MKREVTTVLMNIRSQKSEGAVDAPSLLLSDLVAIDIFVLSFLLLLYFRDGVLIPIAIDICLHQIFPSSQEGFFPLHERGRRTSKMTEMSLKVSHCRSMC